MSNLANLHTLASEFEELLFRFSNAKTKAEFTQANSAIEKLERTLELITDYRAKTSNADNPRQGE